MRARQPKDAICALLDLPSETLPPLVGIRASPLVAAPSSVVPFVEPDIVATQEKETGLDTWCLQLGGTVVTTLLGPFLPIPFRLGLATWRAWPFLSKGIRCLLQGRMNVDVLNATAIAISLARRDFLSVTIVTTLLNIGEALEEWTRKRSYETLAQSLASRVDTVWVRRNGMDSHIHLDDLLTR